MINDKRTKLPFRITNTHKIYQFKNKIVKFDVLKHIEIHFVEKKHNLMKCDKKKRKNSIVRTL